MKKISILMAVYNPNIPFFIEQLKSLDNQDYGNLELLIIDDCSNGINSETITNLIEENVTNFPYVFKRNPKNMGSNKTFEELTKLANGDYLAYCDQDDIWEKDKLSVLLEQINVENAVISYSDLSIIDEQGNKIADSFKSLSKRLQHKHGENLFPFFLRMNSITGCTMLVDGKIAKEALPFPTSNVYVHDHWLALFASCKGKISYINRPLVQYRIHSNNQIGAKVLEGIASKTDYLEKRVLMEAKKVDHLITRDFPKDLQIDINNYHEFISIRKDYLSNLSLSTLFGMLKQVRKDPVLIIFEIILGASGGNLSKFLLNFAKQ
ncbi:glycosyltransferase family 2 protein [Neobacillus niacini]|uniref:glycosyltransferase family 2 protein n=1 Tax=Neobacillus niacini TaxID=86668 RepID=UPI0005EEDA2E|nr:glycosyltransferase family 2 protein [Neobacillus niacini]